MVGGPVKFKIGGANLIECIVNCVVANEGIIFESCNSRSKIKPMEHYFATFKSVRGNYIEIVKGLKQGDNFKIRCGITGAPEYEYLRFVVRGYTDMIEKVEKIPVIMNRNYIALGYQNVTPSPVQNIISVPLPRPSPVQNIVVVPAQRSIRRIDKLTTNGWILSTNLTSQLSMTDIGPYALNVLREIGMNYKGRYFVPQSETQRFNKLYIDISPYIVDLLTNGNEVECYVHEELVRLS